MKDDQQFSTSILELDVLWKQLRSFLSILKNNGIREVDILFGSAWGNFIYPGVNWEYIRLPVEQVESRIIEEEEKENGKFGSDDLFLTHPDISFEIQFCHEADIHLWYEEITPLLEEVVSAWEISNLNPRQFIKQNNKWLKAGI